MISQKSFSFTTLCTLLQPGSASGNTVGLFIPGSKEIISFRFSFGAFSRIYFVCLAFRTERIRNNNFSSICCCSIPSAGWRINTASECKMVSTSLRPFMNNVDPLLTRSTIASARPIPGAISTDPLISWISARIFFSFRNFSTSTG